MNKKKTKYIILLITFSIICTIGVQFFWNYENYQINKLIINNEVQNSFEKSIKSYYKEINEATRISFYQLDNDSINSFNSFDKGLDFLKFGKYFNNLDSTSTELPILPENMLQDSFNLKAVRGIPDRKTEEELKEFSNFFSITIEIDSVDFEVLTKYFNENLLNEKIKTTYTISHLKNDTVFSQHLNSLKGSEFFEITSSTGGLPAGESLQLKYANPIYSIFKRSLTGISLSFLLSALIIGCLLYLLKIINNQKELAEIKNDLISNITHEFKTPISTAFIALEGIKNFNDTNDKAKTENYLALSNQQLTKLNQMVEKLLETATLDSDQLLLQKEEVNVVLLLKKLTEKHQLISDSKTIEYTANITARLCDVDVFHFENAISNLIDNAIKYGGDTIKINLNSKSNSIEIIVADDGKGIDKNNSEKIFDKFYRIPTGNRHDVKGFGIGLFYTKKIIEKHGGSISLLPNSTGTIFKITL